MILEFVLGVIAGSLFANGRVSWPMCVAAGCAIGAVLASDPASRVIVFGIPSACLVIAAAFASRRRLIRHGRSVRWRGSGMRPIRLPRAGADGSLAATSIASLVPAIPPLALIMVTSGIVVALGLLLNILAERPLLRLCRRIGPRRTEARLIPEVTAPGGNGLALPTPHRWSKPSA